MRVMEVRSCCPPNKLLGWLPIPDIVDTELDRIRFLYDQKPMVESHELVGHKPMPNKIIDTISLPVVKIFLNNRVRWYDVLLSDNHSIETLRKINGFIENPRNKFK